MTPGPSKMPPFLSLVAPQPPAKRRRAALLCSDHALTHPEPEVVLNELLDVLGLYETVGEP